MGYVMMKVGPRFMTAGRMQTARDIDAKARVAANNKWTHITYPIQTKDNFEQARDFLASVGVVYRENYRDEDGEMDHGKFEEDREKQRSYVPPGGKYAPV